jgi:hypothetical protein
MTTRIRHMTVYQLKLTMKHIDPPIWRRILIHPEITLKRLHQIIQKLMGWYDYHLYQFQAKGQTFSPPGEEIDLMARRPQSVNVPISWLASYNVKSFVYEYDFGDGWEIIVRIEKVLEKPDFNQAAICIDGGRSGPLEDSGGPFGYMEKLEIMKNPDHEDHAELSEWMPANYDAEKCDIASVNNALGKLKPPKSLRSIAQGEVGP